MAIAWVANVQTPGGVTGGTSAGINTTGANLIVMSASYYSGGGLSISDSKGNTYTGLITSSTAENNLNTLGYCLNPIVTTNGTNDHTFTITGASGSNYSVLEVLVFSGALAASVVDGAATASSAAATTVQPGSRTPAQAGSLIVTGSSSHDGSGASVNSGFTISNQSTMTVSTFYAGAAAYLIQGAAAAVNPTWTVGTGADAVNASCATMAVFKPAATAAQVPYQPNYQRAPLLAQ